MQETQKIETQLTLLKSQQLQAHTQEVDKRHPKFGIDDQLQLTVDRANAFAFKVDDIDRQSHINFEALATFFWSICS